MSFPFSYTFEHSAETSLTVAEMIDRIETELLRRRVSDSETSGSEITFRAGMLRLVSNHNLFSAVTSGRIAVGKSSRAMTISVEVTFTQMLVLVSAMVFGFMGTVMVAKAHEPLATSVPILCAMWLWMFGVNYLFTVSRIKSWTKSLFADPAAAPVPWWKFTFEKRPDFKKPLKPFEPAWQPAWLRNIPWRWKLTAGMVVVLGVWNTVMFWPEGDKSFAVFWQGALKSVLGINIAIFLIIPYFIGRSIEKWNEQVEKKNRQRK